MELFFLIVFIGSLCLWGWSKYYLQVYIPRKERKEKDFVNYAEYNEKNQTLFLRQRSPKLADKLKIVQDRDIRMEHVPEKIHFGAATVGGITTGGTYTTGGYDKVTGIKKNGLYRIEYKGHFVSKIKLTDELYEQAKKSIMAEYLNETDKSIDVVSNSHSLLSREGLEFLKTCTYGTNKMFKMGYPTYTKCKNIISWITF